MRKWDPTTAPWVGDWVPYVIVQGAKNAKAYEKSEDPMFVLENDLALDYEHYIEHHIKNPLLRLFQPILVNAEKELFSGDHMKNVYKPKMTENKLGGFSKFLTVSKQCLGCPRAISKESKNPLCDNC